MAGTKAKEIGLYVHVPFCLRKCPYCDFTSFLYSQTKADAYLDALVQEFSLYQNVLAENKVTTIYIGGGTPTSLTDNQLKKLLSLLPQSLEVTIEANPKTLTIEKLKLCRLYGVNRLSLGVQSFSDKTLASLGRIYQRTDVDQSLKIARQFFSNINLDLMSAVPDQSLAEFEKDLSEAVKLNPEHISVYQLTLEPDTPFYTRNQENNLPLPSEEESLQMYNLTIDLLTSYGYQHYEISNFARLSYQCLHNKLYWQNKEYLGLGLGSTSYLKGIRFSNTQNLEEYISRLKEKERPVKTKEKLTGKSKLGEYLMLGLRLLEGVNLDTLSKRVRKPVQTTFQKEIDELIALQLLKKDESTISLTDKGLRLANEVFQAFIV